MADGSFPLPNGFNLSNPQQHHIPNQHIPPGVPSQQDGALWNRLQHEFAQQTAQMNSNAQQMLYQQPAHLAHLQANQNTNPLLNQQFRGNPAATPAQQNQQNVNPNSSLLGAANPGMPPTSLGGGLYNIAHGQVPPQFSTQLAALNHAQQKHHGRPGVFPGAGQAGHGQQQQAVMGGMMLSQPGPMDGLHNSTPEALMARLRADASTNNGLPPQLQYLQMNPQYQSQYEALMAQQRHQQPVQSIRPQSQQLQQQQQQNQLALDAAQQSSNQQQQQQPPRQLFQGPSFAGPSQPLPGQSQAQLPLAQQLPQDLLNKIGNPETLAKFLTMPLEELHKKLQTLQRKILEIEEQLKQYRLILQNANPQTAPVISQNLNKLSGERQQLLPLFHALMDIFRRRTQGLQAGVGQSGGVAPGPPKPEAGPSAQIGAQISGWNNMKAQQGPPLQMNQQQSQQMGGAQPQTAQQEQMQQSTIPQRVPSATPSQQGGPPQGSETLPQQGQPANLPQPQGPPQQAPTWEQYFWMAYRNWLQRQGLNLDSPIVEGQLVDVAKLFLIVGVLGGMAKVDEHSLWPHVAGKIGLPHHNVSPVQMGNQLQNIYRNVLSKFEIHWCNAFRQTDPKSPFPLPPGLQHLYGEILKHIAPLPSNVQQQQAVPQGPSMVPTNGAMNQSANTMQHAVHQQQNILSRTQPAALSLQSREMWKQGMSAEQIQQLEARRELIAQMSGGNPAMQMQAPQMSSNTPSQLSQRGQSSQRSTPVMAAAQRPPSRLAVSAVAGAGPSTQQATQQHTNAAPPVQAGSNFAPTVPAAGPLPTSGLRAAISPEQLQKAGAVVKQMMEQATQQARLRRPLDLPEDHKKSIIAHWRNVIALVGQAVNTLVIFASILPHEVEELKKVVEVVALLLTQHQLFQSEQKSFIFTPQEMKVSVQRVTTFVFTTKNLQSRAEAAIATQNQQPPQPSQQPPPQPPVVAPQTQPPPPPTQLHQQPPNAISRPPTADPARPPPQQSNVPPNSLQIQQHQQPQPPQVNPAAQAGPSHLQKMQAAAKPRKAPGVGSPAPASASTPPNHPATPVHTAESPNTPRSPAVGSKPGVQKPKQPIPPRKSAATTSAAARRPSKSITTPKVANAEVPTAPKQEPERPASSKREREEDMTAVEGSTGGARSPKRTRVDPQDELDAKRAEDVAAANVSFEAAYSFLTKSQAELELAPATATAPPKFDQDDQTLVQQILQMCNEGGVLGPAIKEEEVPIASGSRDTIAAGSTSSVTKEEEAVDWSWFIDETVVGETPELIPSVSSQGPTPNSDGEGDLAGDKKSAMTTTAADISVSEAPEYWSSLGMVGGDARYYSDDSAWRWEGEMKSNGEWPMMYPSS